MELKIGKHCEVEFCNLKDFLPSQCKSCEKYFCQEHTQEDDHECEMKNKQQRKAFVCPLCLKTVFYREHQIKECDLRNREKALKQGKNSCCESGNCKQNLNFLNKIQCQECNRSLCIKHRLPEDHNCSLFLRKDKLEKQIFQIREQQKILQNNNKSNSQSINCKRKLEEKSDDDRSKLQQKPINKNNSYQAQQISQGVLINESKQNPIIKQNSQEPQLNKKLLKEDDKIKIIQDRGQLKLPDLVLDAKMLQPKLQNQITNNIQKSIDSINQLTNEIVIQNNQRIQQLKELLQQYNETLEVLEGCSIKQVKQPTVQQQMQVPNKQSNDNNSITSKCIEQTNVHNHYVNQTELFGYFITEQQFMDIFGDKKYLNILETVYKLFNQKGEQYFSNIRDQLGNMFTNLQEIASVSSYTDAYVTKNKLHSTYKILSKQYPKMIKINSDDNSSFYRAFIVSALISIISSHNYKDLILAFIDKIWNIKSLTIKLKNPNIKISEQDVGLILIKFLAQILISKHFDQQLSFTQLLAEYNDYPEIDLSFNILCRDLIKERLSLGVHDQQYKEIIQAGLKSQANLSLNLTGIEAEFPVIRSLIADAFGFSLVIQNTFNSQNSQVLQDPISYPPLVGTPLDIITLSYSSDGQYDILLNHEKSNIVQSYNLQSLDLIYSIIFELSNKQRIIRDSISNSVKGNTDSCKICQKTLQNSKTYVYTSKELCCKCSKDQLKKLLKSNVCICCGKQSEFQINSLAISDLMVSICFGCVKKNYLEYFEVVQNYLYIYIEMIDCYMAFKINERLDHFIKFLKEDLKVPN